MTHSHVAQHVCDMANHISCITHTHTHTHIHTRARDCYFSRVMSLAPHTHAHTHTHTYTHLHTPTRTHTYTKTRTHTYEHAHTHTRTHTRTQTHTHTPTHTQTWCCLLCVVSPASRVILHIYRSHVTHMKYATNMNESLQTYGNVMPRTCIPLASHMTVKCYHVFAL